MGGEILNEIKQIGSVGRLSSFSVLNSELARARCRVMYTGRNRNYTDITEEALNKLIDRKGYANIPGTAHLYKGEDGKWRVGGHDTDIVLKAGGGIEFVDRTVPFGVIPEDCNPGFEDVTEKSGEVKRYFCVDVILWTHRYNIMDAVKSDELWFNQSMEITINHCDYDRDDYCVIDDFGLSALCLLNHDPINRENEVEPCFPSASVTRFELDEFKKEFDILLEKYKIFKFDKGDGNLKIEQIKSKLDDKYAAITCTSDTVTAIKKDDFEVFEIPFTVDAEKSEVVFGYDKAVRKYLAVSDTDSKIEDVVKGCTAEFAKAVVADREKDFESKFESEREKLIKDFADQLQTYKTSSADWQAKYEAAQKELDKYAEAEVKAKRDAHKAEIDAVIAKYANRRGENSEYMIQATKPDYSKTKEQVEQDMLIIVGKMAVNSNMRTNSYACWGSNGNTPKGADSGDSMINRRYGNLFAKYED